MLNAGHDKGAIFQNCNPLEVTIVQSETIIKCRVAIIFLRPHLIMEMDSDAGLIYTVLR